VKASFVPMQVPRDPQAATARELGHMLEQLWARAPELRPASDMQDYQLTYPPAVAIQQPRHAQPPSAERFLSHAVGDFDAAGYYFHFGFCQYRCRYCFHYELTTKRDDERKARYVDALLLEMSRVRELIPKLRTGLYFLGGGTPTTLPPALLGRFLDGLHRTLGPPPTRMSTVEAKPITASDDKLALLRDAGFRRINLGVQSLDPELYAFHHHGEDLRVALDAIERARKAGFEFINIDLMTGLERQTPAIWARTLATLDGLIRSGAIDSAFIYPYHDDPRSKTYGRPDALPSFAETAHSDALARELFEQHGWRELGARFYRSPRHVRHELLELARTRINPAYGEVLYHGFGNSSFSIGDRGTYLNYRSLEDYCDAVEGGALGISHWLELDDEQRAARDLSFDLLYSPVTRVRSRRRKYGADAMRPHETLMQRWVELGLGRSNELTGTFSLTPMGKLVHQQMIPQHYLERDRGAFRSVMNQRRELGRRYRGY
jgi:oxygen-independent coproporphyrinogen-3 oxidase